MILEKLKDFIIKNQLQDSRVAVACSGGLDSMVLLNIMSKIHPKKLLYAIHLDHGWHKESNLAKSLVENYCKTNSIKFLAKKYKDGEMKKTENDARKHRYAFFEEVFQKESLDAIFLAHNLNDNVETIIFRIFRGTGTYGLQGIPKKRKLSESLIYRPLLDITRLDIENYAKENNLNFYEDPSNSNIKYKRNRVRLKILPQALEINEKAFSNIQQLAELVEEEQSFIIESAEDALASLNDLPWSLEKFRTLDRVIQRKILEMKFCSNIKFLNKFLDAIKEGGFHRINFKKGHFFTIKKKQIYLELTATGNSSAMLECCHVDS